MSDDLIKRLQGSIPPQSGGGGGSFDHIFALQKEAATTLAEAQAEIARLQDQVGDWIVQADEAHARADRMEAALQWCSGSDDFQEGGKARDGWLKICAPLLHPAALTDKPDAGEGDDGRSGQAD